MTNENINDIVHLKRQITDVIEEVTGLDISDPQTNLAERGIDSVALLDILTVIEKKLNIVLNEEVVREFISVTRIAYVVQHALRNLESPSKRRSAAP